MLTCDRAQQSSLTKAQKVNSASTPLDEKNNHFQLFVTLFTENDMSCFYFVVGFWIKREVRFPRLHEHRTKWSDHVECVGSSRALWLKPFVTCTHFYTLWLTVFKMGIESTHQACLVHFFINCRTKDVFLFKIWAGSESLYPQCDKFKWTPIRAKTTLDHIFQIDSIIFDMLLSYEFKLGHFNWNIEFVERFYKTSTVCVLRIRNIQGEILFVTELQST